MLMPQAEKDYRRTFVFDFHVIAVVVDGVLDKYSYLFKYLSVFNNKHVSSFRSFFDDILRLTY
jgi:hypothetical protein